MKETRQRKAAQQPEAPQLRGVDTYGERRPPQGDRAHYDKHGGKLDHDGKPAQSESHAEGHNSAGPIEEQRVPRTGNQQPLPHDDENARRQRDVPQEAKEERMVGRRR